MKSFFLFSFLLIGQLAISRPEYAAKHGYVNCSLCHASPFGGASRNVNGKIYGSHEYQTNPFSKQDLFSFDTRMELFYTKGVSTTRGVYFMAADPTMNIPLYQTADGQVLDRFVYSLGLAPMETNTKEREAYFVHTLNKPEDEKFFSQIVLGRFLLPFGLMTDEHRTYTRLQTKTSNFDFDYGVGFTGDPTSRLHWDASFTSASSYASGATTQGGTAPGYTNDSPYGVTLNLRYRPGNHPGYFGVSALSQNSQTLPSSLEAYSIYNVISFENIFKKTINWQIEFVYAKGFTNPTVNSYMGRFFIPADDTAWNDTLKDAKSYGFYSLLNYELSSKWLLLYKYDQLVPDTRFTADSFSRNSAGAKYFLNSNMDVNFRIEQSNSTRPGLTEAATLSTVKNAFFILLHGWI